MIKSKEELRKIIRSFDIHKDDEVCLECDKLTDKVFKWKKETEIIMLGKRSGVRKAFKTVGIIIFILWMFIILLIADNYTIRCFVYELQDQQKWNEKRLTLLLEIEEHKVKEEQP